MQRSFFILVFACAVLMLSGLSGIPHPARGQATPVFAEAIGQANLRSTPGTDAAIIGQIVNGTRYPVLGRSEFFPWLLLGEPAAQQPIGWVFQELVTISGDASTVPISTTTVTPGSVSLSTPSPTPPNTASAPLPPGVTPVAQGAAGGGRADVVQATPTSSFTVTGVVNGEINIRYGPGTEYPRVGVAFAGETLVVTATHTQFPWVQVQLPESPNGYGWVARDLLEFQGDVSALPAISQTTFNLPTLTPTPPAYEISALPGDAPVRLSPGFQALGEQVWNTILAAGFQPELSRLGALYIQDLQTGEALTFGSDIAFSGTSINKIAILVELFELMNTDPNLTEAIDIANTMICSENVATNRLLGTIGAGDALAGADRVTAFLRELGLQNTYIAAPYDTTTPLATATTPPRGPIIPETRSDRSRANPDLVNQLTVDEMGWLLGSVYECAAHNSGPLMERFPGQFTPNECQKIIHVMQSNTVDALLRAGVPANIPVAHKHGWIEDTHSNAALFLTPGGDYVIVMVLYQPSFLNFQESLPLMAEVSRQVYNYFNPEAPQAAIRDGFIPDTETCDDYDPALLDNLISPFYELPVTPRPTRTVDPNVTVPLAPSSATPTPVPTETPPAQPSPSPTPTLLG